MISLLLNALWPLLTLAIVALWTAAIADITRHRRRGTLTGAGLLCMVAAVSAVALVALAGISADFAGGRFEAVSGADPGKVGRGDFQGRTYLFSFGMEHASNVAPSGPTSTAQHERPG